MNKLLICFVIFLIPCTLFSQTFGGNPPSIKWKQIDTDSARIIFPNGLDSQAQRVATLVHYLAAGKPVSLGDQVRKINIVLQNQTTVANGYVGLGPYRSEFFLTPSLNNFDEGSIAWVDQLAVHEYRHVVQFNNFRNGLSKLMYTLFGEDGLSLAINASVPDWFYEGDAVFIETVLTNQGRGRLPLFLNAYRSLWLEGKNYSWMKLRNGSYKNFVPNHYYLGYLLVNYGREKYGADFWTKVTKEASAYKSVFYPFQHAVKKYAGIDFKNFYTNAFEYYKSGSSLQLKNRMKPETGSGTEVVIQNITVPTRRFVTSYTFPYQMNDDSLLYLKTSYRQRPAFYIKDKEGEHRLRVKDIANDRQFSYRNGRIVYSAYETDPRWGWVDYGVIKMLDIKTGEQKTLTRRTKYFTPDISDDGSLIAAVQVAPDGKSELHILEAATGKLVHAIRSSEISLFTDPKFIDEHSLVTAVRLKDGKMALALVNVDAESIVRITTPSFNVVGYPCVNNGIVYFTASYLGNDDVFALKLDNKKGYKISNGPLGNYFVNAAKGKITWSAFTANGYQLRQLDEKDITWSEPETASMDSLLPIYTVSHSNFYQDFLAGIKGQRKFTVTGYKKTTRLLNFHSWRPYYSDPEFTFSVYGENILNTLQTELNYLYNRDDKTNAVGFSGIYGGWFPYVNGGAQYTFDQQIPVGNRLRQWGQLDTRIGFSIPLNMTRGKLFSKFSMGTDYVFRSEFNKGFYKDSLGTVSFSYLNHYITWSQQVQQALQHIYPKLGYSVSLNDRHTINRYSSWQFLGGASIYLPGFFSTHSWVFTSAFQEIDTLDIVFSNRFPYARGYTTAYFARMWKVAANYHFPLCYPDWGFGNIVYLQRIRGNVFYDYQKVYSFDKKNSREQRSVGGEIYADTRWWNQYPLTFGFRVSRLLDNDFSSQTRGTVFEFILPVSIIPK
jgi:hypothetical protein